MRRWLLCATIAFFASNGIVQAGTTGSLAGCVYDYQTGKPIAGAVVYVSSPAQTEKTTTDASGHYVFMDLTPGRYTVSLDSKGYEPEAIAEVPVVADFQQTVALRPRKRTLLIDHFTQPRFVRPGIVSDVYSVTGSYLPWYGSSNTLIGDQLRFVPGVQVAAGVRRMP